MGLAATCATACLRDRLACGRVHAGKFITDSSTGSERRSRLCEKKKKKMKISPGAPDKFLKI